MTLDRRITLRVDSSGTRNEFDEYVPGALHEYGLWAQISDADTTNFLEEGGERVDRQRTFTIRWRRDVIAAGPELVTIVDEHDQVYNVKDINEDMDPTRRRRFLDITGVMST